MDKKELLKSQHLITKDEAFVKEYKQNPPVIEEQLQWQPGEVIISELSKEDLIQLGSRYLNNISVYLKNILHLMLRTEKELAWLLEKNGVDVGEKFKQDAKEQAELLNARIEEAKKQLKESVKN